jgi:hypothetical protein
MKQISINGITQYDLLSYFQSTLRTMGVYITISFAALVYSRFYRQGDNKSRLHNIAMILMSGVFNVVVHLIGTYLLDDIKIIMSEKLDENGHEHGYEFIEKWLTIVKLLIYVNDAILMLLVLTLINEFRS